MNILFFTKSKPYTIKLLQDLLSMNHTVVVVCKSFDEFNGSEMDLFCSQNDIEIVSHDDIDADDFWNKRYELGISNNYGRKITKKTIDQLKGRIFNLHGAPLPNYKGAFPYNFGIFNNETEWCVTAHYVTQGLDEGSVIKESRFTIDPETISVRELADLCQERAYHLTLEIIKQFENGNMPIGIKQKGRGCYYSRADFEALKRIDLEKCNSEELKKRIHACNCPPFEGAYFVKEGVRFYVTDWREDQ